MVIFNNHFLYVMIWDFWGAQQKNARKTNPKKPTNSPPPAWVDPAGRTWLDFRVISWEVDHQDRCQCGSPLPSPRYAWKGDPKIPRGKKTQPSPKMKKKQGKQQGHLGKAHTVFCFLASCWKIIKDPTSCSFLFFQRSRRLHSISLHPQAKQ